MSLRSTGPEVAESVPCRSAQTKQCTHLETIVPGLDPSSSSASLPARSVSVPSELASTISADLDRFPCLAEARPAVQRILKFHCKGPMEQ